MGPIVIAIKLDWIEDDVQTVTTNSYCGGSGYQSNNNNKQKEIRADVVGLIFFVGFLLPGSLVRLSLEQLFRRISISSSLALIISYIETMNK